MSSIQDKLDLDDVPEGLKRLRTNLKLGQSKGYGKVTPAECMDMRRDYADGMRPRDIREKYGYSYSVTKRHVTHGFCTCHNRYGLEAED